MKHQKLDSAVLAQNRLRNLSSSRLSEEMMKTQRYGTRFIGYSAFIVRSDTPEYLATLDFVSGAVSLAASSGSIMVRRLDLLATAVESLRNSACELQQFLSERSLGQTNGWASDELSGLFDNFLEFSRHDFEVCIASGANAANFIKQIACRRIEVHDLLKQAAEIGRKIKRRPYAEYIDGIKETGFAKVEYHGFALFVDGQLVFEPDYQVALTRVADPPHTAPYSPRPQVIDGTRAAMLVGARARAKSTGI
jgi:hypothetical protein